MQARVSRKLLDRTLGQPQTVRDIAWKGQLRMYQRCRHLMAAAKPKVVATPKRIAMKQEVDSGHENRLLKSALLDAVF